MRASEPSILAIGLPQHFVWLRRIVLAVFVLNATDAVLTLLWVWRGWATEANPIMARLVYEQPLLFVLVKLTIVFLGSVLLWRLRTRRLAVIGIFIGFLAYYWVIVYHLRSLNLNLFGALLKRL